MKCWALINFGFPKTPAYTFKLLKSLFHNRFVLKYDYEFLNCIIEGGKALSRSLKGYPSLSPTPKGAVARIGVGRRNAWHFRLARLGLESLRNFRVPLVFRADFSAALAISSTFCISEQRLGKILAYGTFQARKSKQFDRKCLTSCPGRFSLALEVGRSTSKAR